MNACAAASVVIFDHSAFSSLVMMNCSGPLANAAFAADTCAMPGATAAATNTAAITKLRILMLSPKLGSRRPNIPTGRPLFLVELLHLVVQLVHLRVDVLLFEDAFAHQQ